MVHQQYISLNWGFNDIRPLNSLNISSILSYFLYINTHEIDVQGLRADSSPGERGFFGYFKCRANCGYVFSTKAMRNNIAMLLIGFGVIKGKKIIILFPIIIQGLNREQGDAIAPLFICFTCCMVLSGLSDEFPKLANSEPLLISNFLKERALTFTPLPPPTYIHNNIITLIQLAFVIFGFLLLLLLTADMKDKLTLLRMKPLLQTHRTRVLLKTISTIVTEGNLLWAHTYGI